MAHFDEVEIFDFFAVLLHHRQYFELFGWKARDAAQLASTYSHYHVCLVSNSIAHNSGRFLQVFGMCSSRALFGHFGACAVLGTISVLWTPSGNYFEKILLAQFWTESRQTCTKNISPPGVSMLIFRTPCVHFDRSCAAF